MTLPAAFLLGLGLLAVNQDPGAASGRVGMLPVVTQGNNPPELVLAVGEHLGAGLSQFELVDVSLPEDCNDADCLTQAAREANVTVLVRTSLTAEARDYIVKMELIDGSSGEVLRADESDCEICTYDEVLERLDQEVANLGAPIQEAFSVGPAAPEATIHIVSEPADAIIRIDGEVVGSTPFEAHVKPGRHEIRLSKEGFRGRVESIEIGADEARALELRLARGGEGPALKRILGWSGVGLAVPLLATGIALLVVDENPYDPSCDGLEGTCARRYNTLGGGIAALVGGVAAAGVGATLLILDKRERGNVEAWIGPGGAGLRGRF